MRYQVITWTRGEGARRAAGATCRKVGDTDIIAMGRRCTHFVPTRLYFVALAARATE